MPALHGSKWLRSLSSVLTITSATGGCWKLPAHSCLHDGLPLPHFVLMARQIRTCLGVGGNGLSLRQLWGVKREMSFVQGWPYVMHLVAGYIALASAPTLLHNDPQHRYIALQATRMMES